MPQYSNLHGRKRVRLQDQIVAPHAAPAAGISIARFHKVDRALILRPPNAFHHLISFLVNLDETARWKNWVHGEILMPNVSVGEIAMRKLSEIR
jgi:hypothetical protein